MGAAMRVKKGTVAKRPRHAVAYVYKRGDKYMAQVGGKYLNMWDSEAEAQKVVEKYLGGPSKKKKRSCTVSLDDWIVRFRLIQRQFKDWLPADVTGAVDMRQQNPDFAWSSGILYHIALRGKETKFRELMVQVWSRLPKDDQACLQGLGSVRSTENDRAAKLIHAICCEVASRMQGRSAAERNWWTLNIHRMVGHHSGWLPLLQQLNVIRKTPACKNMKDVRKKPASKRIMEGKQVKKSIKKPMKKSMKKSMQKAKKAKADGKATRTRSSSVFGTVRLDYAVKKPRKMLNYGGVFQYQLVPFSPKLHTCGFVRLAHLLRILRAEPIPGNLQSWVDTIRSVQTQAARLALSNTDSYSFMWIVRLHLVVELMAAKRRLQFPMSFPLWTFKSAFPDQCQWVTTIRRKKSLRNVGQLMRLLQYKRPIELLTMDLCICGDPDLKDVSCDAMRRCSRLIAKKRKDPFLFPPPHTHERRKV